MSKTKVPLKIAVLLLTMCLFMLMLPTAGLAEENSNIAFWTDDGNYNEKWLGDYDNTKTYKIRSAADLAALAKAVNEGYDFSEKTVILTRNIKLSSDQDLLWPGIGYLYNSSLDVNIVTASEYVGFSGTFKGNNYTISGMKAQALESTKTAGLFGYLTESAVIKNVKVTKSTVQGKNLLGGIAGYSLGVISGCRFSGEVSGVSYQEEQAALLSMMPEQDNSSDLANDKKDEITETIIIEDEQRAQDVDSDDQEKNEANVLSLTANTAGKEEIEVVLAGNYIGGIVGWSDSEVNNCYNYGNISGAQFVGGIAGVVSNDSFVVSKCSNAGDIKGGYCVGGVAGYNRGSIGNCRNSGNIIATGAANSEIKHAGGIIGYGYESIVSDCRNSGEVSGENKLGGISGTSNASSISNCSNSGVICGSNAYIAGIIGDSNDTTVTDCQNSGAVSGEDEIGGIAGDSRDGSVSNCSNSGVIGGMYENIGGIIGDSNENTVSNCRNSGEVSGAYDTGGIIGDSDGGSASGCHNSGAVTGSNNKIGGIIGEAENIVISECSNSVAVTGDHIVGGVVGEIPEGTSSFSNCFSTGAVAGNHNVGGVAGRMLVGNSVINCYSTGAVAGKDDIGGVIGESSGTVLNCYGSGVISDVGTEGAVSGGLIGHCVEGSVQYGYWLQSAAVNAGLPGIGNSGTAQVSECYAFSEAQGKGTEKTKLIATSSSYAAETSLRSVLNNWVAAENAAQGTAAYLNWRQPVDQYPTLALKGDFNGDGAADMDDSIYLFKVIMGKVHSDDPLACDFNEDGKVNYKDAQDFSNWLVNEYGDTEAQKYFDMNDNDRIDAQDIKQIINKFSSWSRQVK